METCALPKGTHSIPLCAVIKKWGALKTILNNTVHIIVFLALLTVFKEAALCGFIILWKRSNVMLSTKKVLHNPDIYNTDIESVQYQY